MPRPTDLGPSALTVFLRRYHADILALWEEQVAHLPGAKPASALRLQLPEILDRIAAAAETGMTPAESPFAELGAPPSAHPQQRHEPEFDLVQVVREYALLRDCTLRVMDERAPHMPAEAMRFFNSALDVAITEEVVRARGETLRVVSHDLRTPLSAISLSAGLLARRLAQRPDSGTLRQVVGAIQQAAKRMEYLIRDQLDLARLDSDRLELKVSPVAAAGLIEEAVALQAPLAQEKRLTLVAREGDRRAEVCCDRGRIMQVLSKLIGNAIKYSEPGARVEAGVEQQGEAMRFHVADTGPGIAEHELRRLFEPYRAVRRDGKSGIGLGLLISKGIIEAHAGRIWAESEPGRGSIFYFTLPKA